MTNKELNDEMLKLGWLYNPIMLSHGYYRVLFNPDPEYKDSEGWLVQLFWNHGEPWIAMTWLNQGYMERITGPELYRIPKYDRDLSIPTVLSEAAIVTFHENVNDGV